MSDDKMNINIGVDVTVDTKQAQVLQNEFSKIEAEILSIARATKSAANALNSFSGKGLGDDYAALKRRFTFERRMTAQRKSEESDLARQLRDQDRERESAFRDQLRFATAIARQRAQAEAEAEREIRNAIRETGRMRDREARQALADARRLERERAKAAAQAMTGVGQVRSGAGRIVGIGAAGAAVVGYSAKRGVDALTRSGMSIDAAMNANARMESGVSPAEANRRAAEIRRRSMPIARATGIKTSDYLKARAEALQAGVSDDIVDPVTQYGSQFARINDLPAAEVLESSGYGLTALKAHGKVTAQTAKQFFNKLQYLAANTAASRQNLASFSKRGLSAGAMMGMSIDDTLAFGGAATASGADGEMAARMLASQGTRLAELRMRASTTSRKSHKNAKDREFLSLPRLLGYRSYNDLSAAVSKDAAGAFEQIYAGIGKISDPVKRMEAAELIFGKEFGPITAAMANGGMFGQMRKAVRSSDANNALDAGMAVRAGSFDFIMAQIESTIADLKDSLGLVLKPLWSDLRDWTMKAPQAFGSFEAAFRSGLEGFLFGLGSPDGTLGGALRRWFGDPAGFRVNARAMFDFAKGFATGLRQTAQNLRSLFSVFAGSEASGETIGRLTARFLSLSAACLALAPVLGVIGGLTTIIAGIVAVARAATGIAAGSAGAAGTAGAGALAVLVRFLTRELALGLAAEIGSRRGEIVTAVFDAVRPVWDAIKEGIKSAFSWEGIKSGGKSLLNEIVPAPLQRWFEGDGAAKLGSGDSHWQDPPLRKPVQQLRETIERNTEALRKGAEIQKQSLDEFDFKSLLHPASLSTGATAIGNSIRSTAGRAAGLSGSVGGGTIGGGNPLSGSTPGGFMGGASGMRTRGIMGGGYSGGSVAPAGGAAKNFASLAPKIMGDLQKDFGLDKESAAAILGNLGHESAGMTAHQEGNPLGGGRGGAGWAQWTGPRRRQFEAWAAQRGLDPKSYEANYGFLKHELSGQYKGSIDAVKGATGLDGKTIAFERSYERAGVKHYDRRIGYARQAMGLDGTASGGSAGAGISSRAVDAARSLVGMGSSQAAAALGARMTPGRWCADFVNGALRASNIRGVNSSVANSFLNWGTQVTDKIKEGDVVVTHRGRGPGQPGGHVGLATGNTRTKNGQLQYETVSGNHGGRVGTGWENADSVAVRRAAESVSSMQEAARAAGTVRVPGGQIGGARNAFGGTDPMGGGGGLGSTTPLRPGATGGGGRAGAGAGQTVQNVTINGSHLSPQEMSAAVQRALGQAMDRRTHDVDGYA